MRLQFMKLHAQRAYERVHLHWGAKDLLLDWLRYNGISTDSQYCEIEYNSVYHFYDIILFPGGRVKVADMQRRLEELAKKDHLTIRSIMEWTRWANKWDSVQRTKVRGLRIWIEAECDTPPMPI